MLTQSIVVEPGQDYDVAVRWMPLDGISAWSPLNTERLMPGWGFNEGGFRNLVAAAIGKNPPIVILPGTWPSSGHEIIPALRFKPLAPRPFVVSVTHLHFVPNEVRFALNFNFEHPLYDVVEVQRDGTPIDRRFPDENGNINVDEYAVPGTQQHYRISWFDGFTVRDTGDFAIDIPGTFPYPLDLGFSFDSTRYAGRSATTYMTVADDSARAPFGALVFERRVPPQDWREVFRGNLDLHLVHVEYDIPGCATIEYRMGWGDPAARRYSGIHSVHVASDPQRESITVTPGRVDFRWSVPEGVSLSGTLFRWSTSEPTPQPVVAVQSDGAGIIAALDTTVAPLQEYSYALQWVQDDILVTGPAEVVTTADIVQPPVLPSGASLEGLVNPGRARFRARSSSVTIVR